MSMSSHGHERRRWIAAQCALGFAALRGSPAIAQTKLRFAAARAPLTLPIYVAHDKGYFSAERLDIQLIDCDTGRECVDRMFQGEAKLATAAELPLALAGLRGAAFSMVATVARSDNYSKIVVRRDSDIVHLADLRGRRVGTFVGTSAHYFLETSLLSAGIDPATVHVVPLQPATAVRALGTGQVDALAVFEPYVFHAVRAMSPQARVLPNRRLNIDNWIIAASTAAGGVSERDLEALTRALDRAERFIAEHPGESWAILRKRLQLDEAAVAWMRSDIVFRLELRQSLITGLEAQARWALRGGLGQGVAPNFLDYVLTEPLARVRPGAVSIVK